jgi:hypothetical protein
MITILPQQTLLPIRYDLNAYSFFSDAKVPLPIRLLHRAHLY